MNQYHSPRGKRPAFRRLTYVFIAIAVLLAFAVIINHDGSVNQKHSHRSNKPMAVSAPRATSPLPEGMAIHDDDKKMSLAALPKGVTKDGEDLSLVAKSRKVLSRASQEAFDAATRIEIHPK